MALELWRVSSRPTAFFSALAEAEPRLLRAVAAGFFSVLVALAVAALALIRLSASDAYAPIVLGVLLLGATNWLLVWGLGGLVILRPAGLDLRAWELLAWSWTPPGILALSLLPVVWLAPLPSLALGYSGALVWHLAVLNAALGVFAGNKRLRTMLLYLGLVIALPWVFFAILLFILTPRP